MTDDPNIEGPTPDEKAAAQAVLDNADYIPETDDPSDEATVDDPITED